MPRKLVPHSLGKLGRYRVSDEAIPSRWRTRKSCLWESLKCCALTGRKSFRSGQPAATWLAALHEMTMVIGNFV